ncbi:MAG: diaminopimelate epimerase [bacterium]
MKLNITYMSGAGNTFTVVDNREYKWSADFYSILAPILCGVNKEDAVKTEGLLILNESQDKNSFDVDFFNPDGSFSMMCGNGGRCALMFAVNKKFIPVSEPDKEINFKMAGGIYKGQLIGENVRLFLPSPVEIQQNVKVKIYEYTVEGTYVNVNSDHFVVNYNDVDKIKDKTFDDFCIDTFASPIRFHKDFQPRGVNVNIYSIHSRKELWLRTYERGVEAETGACGTGALSTMLTALIKDEIDLPVTIIPPSKSPLKVDIDGEFPDKIKFLFLEGNAEIKKQTEIEIPENLFKLYKK